MLWLVWGVLTVAWVLAGGWLFGGRHRDGPLAAVGWAFAYIFGGIGREHALRDPRCRQGSQSALNVRPAQHVAGCACERRSLDEPTCVRCGRGSRACRCEGQWIVRHERLPSVSELRAPPSSGGIVEVPPEQFPTAAMLRAVGIATGPHWHRGETFCDGATVVMTRDRIIVACPPPAPPPYRPDYELIVPIEGWGRRGK